MRDVVTALDAATSAAGAYLCDRWPGIAHEADGLARVVLAAFAIQPETPRDDVAAALVLLRLVESGRLRIDGDPAPGIVADTARHNAALLEERRA